MVLRGHMALRGLIVCSLLLIASAAEAQFSSAPFGRVLFGGTTTGPVLTSHATECPGNVAAPVGSMCVDRDDGSVWRKTSGTGTSGWTAMGAGGGSGTVTSVALTTTSGLFTVGGSPITTSGTLTFNWVSQSANCVVAGPTGGGAAAPTCRSLIAADLPAIGSAQITDGSIAFADWATNSCSTGEIPKFDGAVWECGSDAGASSGAPDSAQYLTLATDATLTNERVLTAGTGVSFTDGGAGSTLTVSLADDGVTSAKIDDGTITKADLSLDSCTANQILKVNGGGTAWACAADATGAGGGALDDLTDTVITSPSAGEQLTYNGTNWVNTPDTFVVGFSIDGAGSAITTGGKGFIVVPYSGTITKATLLSTDASATAGSIVIDIWKDIYDNYPPTDADSITASAPPTLSSANKSQDTTLSGWTPTVTAGDILGIYVDSASTVTRVLLQLEVTR